MNDAPGEKSLHKLLWITLHTGLILCAVAGAFTFPDAWFQARMDTLPQWFRTYGMPFFIGLVRGEYMRDAALLIAASVATYFGAVLLIFKTLSGESKPFFQGKSLKDLLLSKPEIPFLLLLIFMIFSAALLSPSFFQGIASTAYLSGCFLIAATAKAIPVSDKIINQLKRTVLFIGVFFSVGLMAKRVGWDRFLPEVNLTAAPYWLAVASVLSFLAIKNYKGVYRWIAGFGNLIILAGIVLYTRDFYLGKPAIGNFSEFPLRYILSGVGPGYTEMIPTFDPSYKTRRGILPGVFDLTAQVGLLGLTFFSIGLISALRLGMENVRRNPDKLFLWITLLFLLVCCFFSNPLNNAALAFLASCCMGFLLAPDAAEAGNPPAGGIKKKAVAYGLALPVALWLCFVLSYVVFKPFTSHVLTQEGRRWLALAYTADKNNREQVSQRLNYARGVFRNAVITNVFNSEAYLGQATAYVELAEQNLHQLLELDDSVTTDSAVLAKGLRMVIDSHVSSSRLILFHPVKKDKLRFPYHQSMSYLLLGRGHDITARSMDSTTATQTEREEFDKAALYYSHIPENALEYEKALLLKSQIPK